MCLVGTGVDGGVERARRRITHLAQIRQLLTERQTECGGIKGVAVVVDEKTAGAFCRDAWFACGS